jgi:hypothetical protein
MRDRCFFCFGSIYELTKLLFLLRMNHPIGFTRASKGVDSLLELQALVCFSA